MPEWRKRIYRALKRYGMFFGDTGGGAGYFGLAHEIGRQYDRVGATDPWESFATANWEETSPAGNFVGFFRYDLIHWRSALAVAAPCVSQGTC